MAEIVKIVRASYLIQRAAGTLPTQTTTTDSSSPARLLKTNPICFVLLVRFWSLLNWDIIILQIFYFLVGSIKTSGYYINDYFFGDSKNLLCLVNIKVVDSRIDQFIVKKKG